MSRRAAVAGLALASLSAAPPPAAPNNVPAIELTQKGGQWVATYALPAPATKLLFTQNIGGGRGAAGWVADNGFEIASENKRDYVRRKDGKPFRVVHIHAPAVFTESPGDWAPFINFSDNSRLVYTPKLLACGDQCPPDPEWPLRTRTAPGEVAILDGQVKTGKIAWSEHRSGRYLFVGHITPVENRNFIAVVDPGLPGPVRQSLSAFFPSFMDLFSTHLGAPAQKPTLFVSYDPHYAAGAGTKGGGAPNQVYLHLYGPSILEDYGRWRINWYLAHEAGHLFQRKGKVGGAESWIHEGAAEMFAALALRGGSPEATAYVESRLTEGRSQCAAGLKQTSLHDAKGDLAYKLAYECGLILQERFDREIRARHPESDGLFALWRDYESRVDKGAPAGQDTYLATVETLAGAETARWARHVINDRLTDPAALLG